MSTITKREPCTAGQNDSSVEKRRDVDGSLYSKECFIKYYGEEGGLWQWNRAGKMDLTQFSEFADNKKEVKEMMKTLHVEDCNEKRVDCDGSSYTKKEFITFYGPGQGLQQWKRAAKEDLGRFSTTITCQIDFTQFNQLSRQSKDLSKDLSTTSSSRQSEMSRGSTKEIDNRVSTVSTNDSGLHMGNEQSDSENETDSALSRISEIEESDDQSSVTVQVPISVQIPVQIPALQQQVQVVESDSEYETDSAFASEEESDASPVNTQQIQVQQQVPAPVPEPVQEQVVESDSEYETDSEFASEDETESEEEEVAVAPQPVSALERRGSDAERRAAKLAAARAKMNKYTNPAAPDTKKAVGACLRNPLAQFKKGAKVEEADQDDKIETDGGVVSVCLRNGMGQFTKGSVLNVT